MPSPIPFCWQKAQTSASIAGNEWLRGCRKMTIIAIVAVDKNLAIGKDGKPAWHYSADLKFFKETTTGNAIVMGYTTYVSIGRPLPNRINIVLSRTKNIEN